MHRPRPDLRPYLGKAVHVFIDRPIGHQHKGMVYPVNYGYIPGLLGDDGEEQDAYVLGVSCPIKEFDGQVIAIVLSRADCEDKLVTAPEGSIHSAEEIAGLLHFQEQYFDHTIIIADL